MNLIPRIGGGALFSWREAHARRSRNVRKNIDMITRFGCAKSGYEALTITIKAGFGSRGGSSPATTAKTKRRGFPRRFVFCEF